MTKGIISPTFATKLHLNYLTYIVVFAFTIHTCFAIHLALRRWGVWNTGIKYLLFLIYFIFIGSFIYVDRFYKRQTFQSLNAGPTSNQPSTNKTKSSNNPTLRTFSLKELAKYNGRNGQPAYVAVNGKVYDLTSVFINGTHFGHQAGQDLTSAFNSYHSLSVLSFFPIVGNLQS